MVKKKSNKRQSINKYPSTPKKSEYFPGGFPLNPNNSDRISFNRELGKDNSTLKISNVSYEININGNWEWIVRYDDHGGTNELHRHERISLKNEMNIIIDKDIKRKATKKKLYEWAIADIKSNYLIYRKKFLTRNGFPLY